MTVPNSRRTLALLVSTTMLASLAIVTAAAPASAQLTCDGRVATITDNGPGDQDPTLNIIEGTNGPDVIVGTNEDDIIDALGGRDIVCGRLGDDLISGGFKRDRIFGGSGHDTVKGGGGPDDLFGFSGNDDIFGGKGNDFIKGGRGTDNCKQGPGSGPIRQCEYADLKVRVRCPADSPVGEDITCTVKVTNRGPDASAYDLTLDEDSDGSANCSLPVQFQLQTPVRYALLRVGRTRSRDIVLSCSGGAGSNSFSARVDPDARDRRPGNNFVERVIDIG